MLCRFRRRCWYIRALSKAGVSAMLHSTPHPHIPEARRSPWEHRCHFDQPCPESWPPDSTASAVVLGLLATSAQATSLAPAAKPAATVSSPAEPPPTGVSAAGTDADATQRARLPISKIRPQRPLAVRQASTKNTKAAKSPAQSCVPADFSSRTGSALVAYVEASTRDCLGTLFGVTGSDAHGVFQESQMLTIANAFPRLGDQLPR